MKFKAVVLFIFLSIFSYNQSRNQRISSGSNPSMNISGNNGKVSINKTFPDGSTKTIFFNLYSLKELDANGHSTEHSITDFNKLNNKSSSSKSEMVNSMKKSSYSFSAGNMLTNNDSLSTSFLLYQSSSSSDDNNSQGYFKFSFRIRDWPFCDSKSNCSGVTCCNKNKDDYQEGEYLDLEIDLQSSDWDTILDNSKITAFGSNISMLLSNEIKIDGSWTDMPSGYPKIIDNGGGKNASIIFRIPRFSDKAEYDPPINK